MMKKKTVLVVCALCIVSMFIGAAATGIVQEISAQLRPDFTVVIDGEEKVFKNVNGDVVYPVLYEGTTYLPVRAIGEMMGKTVYWFEDEKRIELKDEASTVTDADVIVNGSEAAPPQPEQKKPTAKINPNVVKKNDVDTSAFIGEDKAKEIALEKAELGADEVVFERTELDDDDGLWHYEIEFKKGLVEYDAEVKADTGEIIKWEVDLDD